MWLCVLSQEDALRPIYQLRETRIRLSRWTHHDRMMKMLVGSFETASATPLPLASGGRRVANRVDHVVRPGDMVGRLRVLLAGRARLALGAGPHSPALSSPRGSRVRSTEKAPDQEEERGQHEKEGR